MRLPPPSFLDLNQGVPVHPGEPQNAGRWELCRADDLLQAAGLPPYSTSLFRYWHQPGGGKDTRFVPVLAGSPQNASTRSLAEVLGPSDHHLPFNPQGGLLIAATLFPLGFEDYVDLLGGKPWKGLEHGKKHLMFEGPY